MVPCMSLRDTNCEAEGVGYNVSEELCDCLFARVERLRRRRRRIGVARVIADVISNGGGRR